MEEKQWRRVDIESSSATKRISRFSDAIMDLTPTERALAGSVLSALAEEKTDGDTPNELIQYVYRKVMNETKKLNLGPGAALTTRRLILACITLVISKNSLKEPNEPLGKPQLRLTGGSPRKPTYTTGRVYA